MKVYNCFKKRGRLYRSHPVYSLIKSNDLKLENAEGKIIIKSEVVLKIMDKMTEVGRHQDVCGGRTGALIIKK
jgi:hypothetical protein